MKKTAIFLTAAALALSTLTTPLFAKDMKFSAAYGTPSVDGTLDDVYKQGTAYEVKYANKTDSYSTANVYCAWNETTLYIYADVTDDTPSTKADTTNTGDIWKTDCIELNINLVPGEPGKPHEVSKGACYLVAPMYGERMDIYGTLPAIDSVKNGTKVVVKTTDKGWAVELAVPLFGEASGINPKGGDMFNFFSLLHNDTNNDNARDSETFPNSQLEYGTQDTSKMDYVVLLDKPAEPVEVTESAKTADIGAAAALCAGISALALALKLKKK